MEVYAVAAPRLHQDTTPIALYGAYEDAPQTAEAHRPAYGHSTDGRPALKQVLLSLGVSGDGGVPLRLGMRDGNTSDSGETPVALEEGLALGLEGVQGSVADSQAYSHRTLGLCREKGFGLVPLVPRTCAGRQALEAWGAQQPALPLLVAKPGRTKDEACRQWHGHSVIRPVEVESSDGRVAREDRRFLVVHASQRAQQHMQRYASAPAQAAQVLTDPVQRVHARWFAWAADAAAAVAEYEPQEPGRRGRRPHPWRSHAVRYRVVADPRRPRRAWRGRPAKSDRPPLEVGYRLGVDVEALANSDEANGWMVLATTGHAEVGSDRDSLQAYQAGPKYPCRTWVSLEQEAGGYRARVARAAGTDCGLGHADGYRLARL